MSAPIEKKYLDVLGKRIAYVEQGQGDPIVFVHGNPTSSYLWRNIMPRLSMLGRCIAIDLIGMGDSDKLDGEGRHHYRFVTHRSFFEKALRNLGINTHVTLVLHDWGSA
ncbi:MAG: alpha/beta fold hydrolase, partial [Pseudomonadota bacterium]